MTDGELLELAAKAAGYKLKYSYKKNGLFFNYGQQSEKSWNPLLSDGDALRLAAKLGMQIDIDHAEQRTYILGRTLVDLSHDNDPYTATRRAIVRAAAEIGKGMK